MCKCSAPVETHQSSRGKVPTIGEEMKRVRMSVVEKKETLGGNELAVCWRERDIWFREARITGQNLFLTK